jgi:hypothetical protein
MLARSVDNPKRWSLSLPAVTAAYNMITHTTTKLPPVVVFHIGLGDKIDDLPPAIQACIRKAQVEYDGFDSLRNYVLYGVKVGITKSH